MPSFDVESKLDLHELTNAVDQANRELTNRFDFKGTGAVFEREEENVVVLKAQAEFQLKQMLDILIALKTCAGNSRYLLPSRYDADAPMSRATFNRVTYSVVDQAKRDGLPLERYLSLLDMLNPMHRLWSDGRWNKLTVAQGCYWKKCTFCDTSLDYISRYEAASAKTLVDRIEAIVAETGQTGFHFVDEAAPPKVLKALAAELQRRGVSISWWGNIRFEKTFTPDLCRALAASGCIAISGGLEVASDRLLKLIDKGVTVEQVARVTRAFAEAGVMVHAYLMYGFPTETAQETVDGYPRQVWLSAAGEELIEQRPDVLDFIEEWNDDGDLRAIHPCWG